MKELNTLVLIAIAMTAILLAGCSAENFTSRPEPTARPTAAKPAATPVTRTAIEPTAAPAPLAPAPVMAPNLTLPVNPGSPAPATATMKMPEYPRLPPICRNDLQGAFWAILTLRHKWATEHAGSLAGLGEQKVKTCEGPVALKAIADWIEEPSKKQNVFSPPTGMDWKTCCQEVADTLMWVLARWQRNRTTIWMPTGFWGEHVETWEKACGRMKPTVQELLDLLAESGCKTLGYEVVTVRNETMVRVPNHIAETVGVALAGGATVYLVYRGVKVVAAVAIFAGSAGMGTPVAVLVTVTP